MTGAARCPSGYSQDVEWSLFGCARERPRDVRAGRTGAAGPADGSDGRRNGLAVPALRRVRDRRAARQRPGRGGAAGPPRQGAAQRADPARVRGGAVPPLPDHRRRSLRGVVVRVPDQAGIQRAYNNALPAIRALYQDLGLDVSHSKLLVLVHHALTISPRWVTILAIGLPVYALIELVESVGLWLGQRWGEYFAMIATSIFLPWEVWELTRGHITWLKVAAFVINLLLVIYLVWTRRLFGVRGGKAAYDARLRTESSSRWSRPRSPRHCPASPAMAQPHLGGHNQGQLARILQSHHPRRPGDHPGSRDSRVNDSLNRQRRPSATSGSVIEPTTGDGRSWTTCPLLRIRSSPAGSLAGSQRDDHLRGLRTSTDKHARQDLGRYQEDGIGILRALRPHPRPLAGDQESHYDAFMASQPDQRQPDPEQRENEQLPDEPSTDKNRLRSAFVKPGRPVPPSATQRSSFCRISSPDSNGHW